MERTKKISVKETDEMMKDVKTKYAKAIYSMEKLIMEQQKDIDLKINKLIEHQKAVETFLQKTNDILEKEKAVQPDVNDLSRDAVNVAKVMVAKARESWLEDPENENERYRVLVWGYILKSLEENQTC